MTVRVTENLRQQIKQGISILGREGVIAYPTDTIYGVGAGIQYTDAIERIYSIKERPINMALPVLLSHISRIEQVASYVPAVAWQLALRFMPGALTLVLYKSSYVPDIVTAGGDTVAVRVPAHFVPITLSAGIGMPIVGTSANLSSHPGALSAEEVTLQLGEKIDLVIDGGRCIGGIESTVVDVTGQKPVILREGAISREILQKVCDID